MYWRKVQYHNVEYRREGDAVQFRQGRDPIGYAEKQGTQYRVHTWDNRFLGSANSLKDSALMLLKDRSERIAEQGAASLMHAWDATRPRSQKSSDARATGRWGVGPSDHSSCHKAIEYRERPPWDYAPVPVDKSAAIIGTLLHDAITDARRQMMPWRMFAIPVIVPGLDVEGEADEFDPLTGRVTDYKTAGDNKWERVGKYGAPEAEWKQVHEYALGLERAEHVVREVELLYVNRSSGHWESHVRPYSREYALAAVAELHGVIDSLAAGLPLPRIRAGDELLGPTVNTLCARFCPAVKHCWNLDEVPPNRTPEGFLLVRPDDDGAIAATLVEYDDARAAEKEGKVRKEYTRALLAGLEPGRYGDMTLNWTGGRPIDKPDPDGRIAVLEREMLAAIEQNRPPAPPASLPVPVKSTTSAVTIQVKPVRAADLAAEKQEVPT